MINAKNGRKGPLTPGMRPVDEGTRIDITKVIADFQSSDDTGASNEPKYFQHVQETGKFSLFIVIDRFTSFDK